MGNMRRTRKHQARRSRHPDVVYRFCKEEVHAEALCRGSVWISTLDACRGYEDPKRGDKGEGIISYNTGYIRGDGTSEAVRLIGARAGIDIGSDCKDITLSDNDCVTKIPDAYVVCTTLDFAPEKLSESFGRYCVRIRSPYHFFVAVTEKLQWRHPLGSANLGPVIYEERHFRGLEPEPGPIGFVKPPDEYADQREFRFLWGSARHSRLCQFSLAVPSVAELCDRVA